MLSDSNRCKRRKKRRLFLKGIKIKRSQERKKLKETIITIGCNNSIIFKLQLNCCRTIDPSFLPSFLSFFLSFFFLFHVCKPVQHFIVRLYEYRLDIIATIVACTFILLGPIELHARPFRRASQINPPRYLSFPRMETEWELESGYTRDRKQAIYPPLSSFLPSLLSFFSAERESRKRHHHPRQLLYPTLRGSRSKNQVAVKVERCFPCCFS